MTLGSPIRTSEIHGRRDEEREMADTAQGQSIAGKTTLTITSAFSPKGRISALADR